MGTAQSQDASTKHDPTPKKTVSRHVATFRKLYEEFTAADESGEPANNNLFRTRFQRHFGGPYLEFGYLLYQQLFGQVTNAVDTETFIDAVSRLERVCSGRGSHQDAKSQVFSIFAQKMDTLNEKTLTDLVHMSASLALVLGSDLHDDHHTDDIIPRDHTLISALIQSAWLITGPDNHELSMKEFHSWLSLHCPRLLDGVLHWITSSLLLTTPTQSEGAGKGVESHQLLPTPHYYHLPVPRLASGDQSGDRGRETQVLIWALSVCLPLVYLGHSDKEQKRSKTEHCSHAIGGSWTLLYSSSQHGFSMNRFQHHCSDYRDPSVMIVTCRSRGERGEGRDGEQGEAEEYTFSIAVDTEWRDVSYYWGGERCCLLQLRPLFLLLSSGPKIISLNEKKRGFPTGLRVMSSETNPACLLEVDSALETARYRGIAMTIVGIEVWGCGDEEAVESQQKMKNWEKRLILKRQKIKASTIKDEWANSPDRYILEMGGVTTQRPTEQHQQ